MSHITLSDVELLREIAGDENAAAVDRIESALQLAHDYLSNNAGCIGPWGTHPAHPIIGHLRKVFEGSASDVGGD